MVKVWLGEDDGVFGGRPPGLHEVYGITTAQGRVTGEDHAGGLVHRPQVPMDVGKMLQTTTADELEERGKDKGK